MSTSSEDVLHSVAHVKYKKGDGTLYVMNQRLAWMLEHRDTVAVSHKYADIKTQKISPVGKAKVQLQVVLHDGGCSTFHFTNPAGAVAQAQDRDQVKEMLQNLLPQFRRQVNKELEEKSRLLSVHPILKHMYEDLVITKVLTSEEYWNTATIKQYTESQTEKQEIGVSGAFLADVQPQTDGCNGLRYNLTEDIIEAVFKTYPAVKRKYTDYVPNKMSEAEFWTKFFQSHYFHRDRIASSSKDLFTECGRLDDLQLGRAMQRSGGDPLLDMGSWGEGDPLGEGEPPQPPSHSHPASVHRSMIKRFNQHSIMVLKAGDNTEVEKAEKAAEGGGGGEGGSLPPPTKKQRILQKIDFEDLHADPEQGAVQQLELSKVERYLHGPTVLEGCVSSPSGSGARSAARGARSLLLGWAAGGAGPRPLQPSAPAAVGALGELSPGGALMRHHHTSLAQLVGAEVEQELRRLYLGAGELLRTFWRCLPPASATAPSAPDPDKVAHSHEALQRFRIAKLKPFQERMLRELSPLAHSLTRHLSQLLHAATIKYTLWLSRQAKVR